MFAERPLEGSDPSFRRLRASGGDLALEVAGRRVDLVKIDPVEHPAVYGGSSAWREKTRYLVRVDGVERGHLVYPIAWQAVWEAYSLGRARGAYASSVRLREPLDANGAYVRRDRLAVAAFFPAWIDAGDAPTREEIAAHEAELTAARERERRQFQAESAASDARRRALADELEVLRVVEAAERDRRLAALDRMLDRLRSSLDNEEAEALAWAVEQLRAAQ